MTLTADQIEDGTGKPTAIVYEDLATVAAWLTIRGLTVFAGKAEADQIAALVTATSAAEDEVRLRLRCSPITDDQGLLFPASGAYSASGDLFAEDARPRTYLEGIRLLAEEAAAGRLVLTPPAPAGIKEERSRQGGIVYRDNAGGISALAAHHPEAHKKIASVIPRL